MEEKISKKLVVLAVTGLAFLLFVTGCSKKDEQKSIGMSVEFMDHAACAYIAQNKGWYQKEGLNISSYESYVTGMALASSLSQGDTQVAYICLVPAINAYANAGVPIKIVAGTHKHGYGLVVDPEKIKSIENLEKPGSRIGCVREGGAVDVILHRLMEKYDLDEKAILGNVQRMNPPMQVLAMKTGRLDAAFITEHYATVAEKYGCEMFIQSEGVWPKMQGSVLAVKKSLLDDHTETVRKLVEVSQKATDWAKQNKDEAASIVAEELQATKGEIFPAKVIEDVSKESKGITPEIMYRSMWKGDRMRYTTSIDPKVVQDIIDYMAKLGYIQESFPAAEILDLRFMEQVDK